MSLGPNCPAGLKCENRIFLEEYERVDREYERILVRKNAELRIEVNKLQADLSELRDPDEVRGDGKRVRRDRWESGLRNIANALGMGMYSFDIPDIVERVKALAAGQAPGVAEEKK